MRNQTIRYLIVPGWQGSADEHWQSHWQRSLPNSARVEQTDWLNPDRASWVAELQRTIDSDLRPTILIAHSLGCITVAHWAAQAPIELLRRVRAALLVAPADVERANCPPALQNFAPIPQHLLPFPSQLVGSDNDSAASAARAIELARDWGSDAAILSGAGHINVKSGHQRWEQGFAYLYRLQGRIELADRRRA
ncbi:alpha/beta hydrolase [Pseudomonas sp.]|uniref:alpha/beta hydrolase n=1 Tax=Pseudomonas sp. TaxID=306 RepID=UPI002CC75A8E|nr:alpha/beta hydrolase [Pseudomonas sp.]HUE94288.1 alpha/beta hydrolase [Pseudomonas sp.]